MTDEKNGRTDKASTTEIYIFFMGEKHSVTKYPYYPFLVKMDSNAYDRTIIQVRDRSFKHCNWTGWSFEKTFYLYLTGSILSTDTTPALGLFLLPNLWPKSFELRQKMSVFLRKHAYPNKIIVEQKALGAVVLLIPSKT